MGFVESKTVAELFPQEAKHANRGNLVEIHWVRSSGILRTIPFHQPEVYVLLALYHEVVCFWRLLSSERVSKFQMVLHSVLGSKNDYIDVNR